MRTFILVLLVTGLAARAEGSAVERFNALPEAEKQALREKLKAYKQLPPEEKQCLKDNLARFKQLSPE